jgi:osmoprotectant transport system substrate-binding protein
VIDCDVQHSSDRDPGFRLVRAAWRAKFQIALVGLVALLLIPFGAGCGGDEGGAGEGTGSATSGTGDEALPGEGKPAVTLGTKDFAEQFILGELYAQALEARGYTVNLKKNIGPTETIDTALTSGEIDGYPEYLGTAVTTLAGVNEPASSAEETYRLAKEFFEGRGQTISEQTPFFNVDAIGTTTELADQNRLKSVADLEKLPSFTLGARPEFEDRFQGLRGMREVYGLTNAEFVSLPQGITYGALDDESVDTINVFSTDAQLASGKYVVLEDPEGIFGYQHVALVIDQAKLEELGGDEFMSIINDVNALLTNDEIIAMNEAVVLEKRSEAEVAQAFLEANGLLGN